MWSASRAAFDFTRISLRWGLAVNARAGTKLGRQELCLIIATRPSPGSLSSLAIVTWLYIEPPRVVGFDFVYLRVSSGKHRLFTPVSIVTSTIICPTAGSSR